MKISLATASTQEPITLEEAKNFMRIDTDDDDGLILTQITAAREYAENIQLRKFLTQTWWYYLDDWPDTNYIELPFPPLLSVASITYTDYNSVATPFTDFTNDIVSEPGRIVLDYGCSWPTATLSPNNPILIIFACGYGTPNNIPQVTKSGMLLIIDELYENRETNITGQTVNRLPLVDTLLGMNRIIKF